MNRLASADPICVPFRMTREDTVGCATATSTTHADEDSLEDAFLGSDSATWSSTTRLRGTRPTSISSPAFSRPRSASFPGASHGAETRYVFKTLESWSMRRRPSAARYRRQTAITPSSSAPTGWASHAAATPTARGGRAGHATARTARTCCLELCRPGRAGRPAGLPCGPHAVLRSRLRRRQAIGCFRLERIERPRGGQVGSRVARS